MKKNTLLICLIGSVLITVFSFFYVANESILFSAGNGTEMRGFPTHYLIRNNQLNGGDFTFKTSWAVIDIIIWFLVLICLAYLLKISTYKKRNIILLVIISTILLWASFQDYKCISGFPVEFIVECVDVDPVTINHYIFGAILNTAFWFSTSAVLLGSLYWFSLSRVFSKIKYFIAPIFLTFFGFLIYNPCTGMLCIFAGRGFPLGYYNAHESVYWPWFFVDLLFMFVSYGFFVALWGYISRKREQKNVVITNYPI